MARMILIALILVAITSLFADTLHSEFLPGANYTALVNDTVPLRTGWNYISAPYEMPGVPVGSITTMPPGIIVSNFFGYNGIGYEIATTLLPGMGYLVKSSSPGSMIMSGIHPDSISIPIGLGWNLIGSFGGPILTSSIPAPQPGTINSDFFSWDGRRYVPAGTIVPGAAYWVYSDSSTTLIFSTSMVSPYPCGTQAPVITTSATTPVNQVIRASVGVPLTFQIIASCASPPANIAQISSGSLPPGAVTMPALPTSGSPAVVEFSWTPTPADTGFYPVSLSAMNECGSIATKMKIVIVVESQPYQFVIPITAVSMNGDTSIVYWGYSTDATRCLNPSLGELPVPPIPPGPDPRWIFQQSTPPCSTPASGYLDVRSPASYAEQDTFILAGLGGGTGSDVRIFWPDLHPYLFSSVSLYDPGTLTTIDMLTQNEYQTTSDRILIVPSYFMSSISGMKFFDRNNNEIFDAGDTPLAKWKIVLSQGLVAVDSTVTDSLGRYLFASVLPGVYRVSEELKPHWMQTFPPSQSYDLICNGSHFTNIDFGNFIMVNADTAQAVVIQDLIPTRPEAPILKAFRFRYTGPVTGEKKVLGPLAGDGALPAGAVVRSWNGSNAYVLPSEKYLFWMDLTGDLKFGHPCIVALVDKETGEIDTLPSVWWPTIETDDGLGGKIVQPVFSSWDERTTSPDLIYGNYTVVHPMKKQDRNSRLTSGQSIRPTAGILAGSTIAALLIGGKAESTTELACWQHDIDSVKESLVNGVPPAVNAENIWIANDATTADLGALYDTVRTHGFDTLYFYFTGHGEANGIVLNDVGGRVTLTYGTLANNLCDSLGLKRLHILIDASNSGSAIDDFMRDHFPVVNLVMSTDSVHSAGTGLPTDTSSVYTLTWRQAAESVPLPPGEIRNWRLLNDTVLNRNSIVRNQHAADSSNAPLPGFAPAGIIFDAITVGDSNSKFLAFTNNGFISLHLDSVRSITEAFSVIGTDTATITRGTTVYFPLKFKPSIAGSNSGVLNFYHNGENSPTGYTVSGFGIATADTAHYRTFSQDSLTLKSIKKKAFRTKFTATFPANSGTPSDGIIIKFNMVIDSLTSIGTFTSAVPSPDRKIWTLSGAVIGIGEVVTISGYGHKAASVNIQNYWWTVSSIPGSRQKGFSSSVQQRLLPLPNAGNIRDAVYTSGYFNLTGGMILGISRPDANKTYGWIRLKTWKNLQNFFPHKNSEARPFDTLQYPPARYKPFRGEQRSLKPSKYNNHLAGELAALRIGIGASYKGLTPIGLGELIFDDHGINPVNGLMIKAIAAKADSALTYFTLFPDTIYEWLDTAIAKINRAFEGPIDTISWGTSLFLKGTRTPLEVGYIHAAPGMIPDQSRPVPTAAMPEKFSIDPCYPNPFNPATTIQFTLPEQALVTVVIYNILGQEIARLAEREIMDEGVQELEFDGTNYASGVYFYRVTAEVISDESEQGAVIWSGIRKMMLMK